MGRFRTEEIYEALFDDDALARLPFVLAEAANARSALMLWQHSDGFTQMIAHTGLPWFGSYSAFAHLDPYFAEAAKPQNANHVLLPNDWIPRSAFERTIIFNELIRRHGDDTVYCTGAGLRSAWGGGAIGVHRGRNDRPFDSEDAKRLASVIVHAERVLRARGEMLSAQRAAALSREILDSVALAVMVVASDRKLLDCNDAAETVLRRADGLIQHNGRLRAVTNSEEQKLNAAIEKAIVPGSPVGTAVAIERRSQDVPYLLTVTPLVGNVGQGRAVVLFRDPCIRDDTLPIRLVELFGLTKAEAEIATELSAGRSLDEISAMRRVSLHTLRAQLKGIMAKMHCHRQSEIAATIAALPPVSE